MASRRAIRRRACGRKVKYDNHEDALVRIRQIRENGRGGGLVPYPCQFCGKYHIGHPPARVRQAIATAKGR